MNTDGQSEQAVKAALKILRHLDIECFPNPIARIIDAEFAVKETATPYSPRCESKATPKFCIHALKCHGDMLGLLLSWRAVMTAPRPRDAEAIIKNLLHDTDDTIKQVEDFRE